MPPVVALVHHADALSPVEDSQRPLSERGFAHAEALAVSAREAGIKPAAIWHSGKLRARQTAEAFYRACNPFADFRMVRGLRPEDDPETVRAELAAESRDVLLVSHMPFLPGLLRALAPDSVPFPQHGIVVLDRGDDGQWHEVYRGF